MPRTEKNLKLFFYFSLAFMSAEIFSLFAYFQPFSANFFAFAVALSALCLTLYRLEYGLLLIFGDLLINSKGYLLAVHFAGGEIPIRLLIFVILMSVWLAHSLLNPISLWSKIKVFFQAPEKKIFTIAFFVLLGGILIGTLNGFFWQQNSFNNFFLDLNGWLYFFIFLPLFFSDKKAGFWRRLVLVFASGIFWLFLKTAFLLYFFAHFSPEIVYLLYRWLRTSGVGEATLIQAGFYRLFFQSYIFILPAWYLSLGLMIVYFQQFGRIAWQKTVFYLYLVIGLLSSFLLLVSFSRSFWLAAALGLSAAALLAGRPIRIFFLWLFSWSLSLIMIILAVVLIAGIVKFPWPPTKAGQNSLTAYSERIAEIKNEPAASSRWQLWPVLWSEIRQAPYLGRGFGAVIIYQSADLRIKNSTTDGSYQTYAFEWGWLDIWLKTGIIGLIAYAGIFVIFFWQTGRSFSLELRRKLPNLTYLAIIAGLGSSALALAAVNFFTPYLNHPLGIGLLLILIYSLVNKKEWLDRSTC